MIKTTDTDNSSTKLYSKTFFENKNKNKTKKCIRDRTMPDGNCTSMSKFMCYHYAVEQFEIHRTVLYYDQHETMAE